MTILGKHLDYTDKDFDSIRARAFNLVAGAFPQWSSQSVAAFGNLLVELFAFGFDVIGKYQDNQAAEARWTQATQRKNLLALAKLIDFRASTATASQVDLLFSIPSPAAGDVPIPKGTIARTKNIGGAVVFRTLAASTIPAGQTSALVTGENSEPESETLTSTGAPNQSFVLSAIPFVDGTAQVTAGNGVYTEVENFLDTTSADRHFTITVDQNDRATLRFGDGVNGAIPTGSIVVEYKTGGGAAGMVEAGSVVVGEGTFTDSFGTPVSVSVTNPNASTPAVDRQTVAQIRALAPLTVRVSDRTVALDDFEINALRVPQVARSLMLTSDQDASIGENTGILFVVPKGGGVATQAVLDAVANEITTVRPSTLTFKTTVAPAAYKSIDIAATVFFSGVTPAEGKARILANLTEFFAVEVEGDDGGLIPNESIDFGERYKESASALVGKFPLSDIYNAIRDTDGVRKMSPNPSDFLLNGEHDDVELELREFPTLGTVTIIDGNTGAVVS